MVSTRVLKRSKPKLRSVMLGTLDLPFGNAVDRWQLIAQYDLDSDSVRDGYTARCWDIVLTNGQLKVDDGIHPYHSSTGGTAFDYYGHKYTSLPNSAVKTILAQFLGQDRCYALITALLLRKDNQHMGQQLRSAVENNTATAHFRATLLARVRWNVTRIKVLRSNDTQHSQLSLDIIDSLQQADELELAGPQASLGLDLSKAAQMALA